MALHQAILRISGTDSGDSSPCSSQTSQYTYAVYRCQRCEIGECGGGGESGNKSSATNRISFKVPLALPVDPITEEELKKREAAHVKQVKEQIVRANQVNRNMYR